ncbi:AB hydrolase-1 domain-containing protein [Mycena venus]|uniref:AB hydrolase-1 domain-containing protein n=1 Tax=Mycena venus TaxID=2733690 RepID=A0A8H7D500_9AGAR|nr:AB hydrolase-1 domain-containing protein [Mycena venus]
MQDPSSAMDSRTKPTFVFVPGVLHTPAHFQILVDSLHTKGYPAERISNPTVGALASTAPPGADAVNVRRVLEELVNDQQKDVVLVCHSYGGIPGSQSVVGLEGSARAKAGQKGGIIKVIFLTAIVPREGENLVETLSGAEIPAGEWMEMNPTIGTFNHNSKALVILYHDLSDNEAEHWVSKLEPMAPHFAIAPATNVCWDADVPKVYILCKTDRVFSFEQQQRMLERVQGDKKRGLGDV